MRRIREQRKIEGMQTKNEKRTRAESKAQREYWKQAKRRANARLTPEQKEEKLRKRRMMYRQDKLKKGIKHSPKCPDLYADLVVNLVKNCSPKKKAKLREKGISIRSQDAEVEKQVVTNLKKTIRHLTSKRKDKEREKLAVIVRAVGSRETQLITKMGMRRETWLKYQTPFQRKRRCDKLPGTIVKSITKFYDDHSTKLSLTKTCSVARGSEKQKSVLNKTTRQLHKDFQTEHSSVSLSLFRKLRPKHVLLVDAHRFRTCLCDVCLNLSYKAQALKTAGLAGVHNKYDLLDLTMCPKEGLYYRPECIQRTCGVCGMGKCKDSLYAMQVEEKETKWKKWETDKDLKRKVQVEKSGNYHDLVKETMEELAPFSVHMHNASWQQQQYRTLRDNLPKNWVVSVQDFAENYRHANQDEISSAYFGYSQSSLLTNVSSYHCSTCSARIDESIVFITSDLKHDPYVVKAACDKLVLHLQKRGAVIDKHVIFSDGCSAQFKSKVAFSVLINSNTERSYFGSQHGKSQCDALGGIIKKAATRFVASNQGTIRSAKELFAYCSKELARNGSCESGDHKLRSFFLLEDIVRPDERPELNTVPNTRKIHTIQSLGNGSIQTKRLACYCDVCNGEQELGVCASSAYTGDWKHHNLKPGAKAGKKRSVHVSEENNTHNQVKEIHKVKLLLVIN